MRELDLDAVTTDFLQTVARIAPRQQDLALCTLRRVPPARWQLEWLLPWWLGEAFGLEPTITRQFVLSNVLGLAAIRLKDDLADEDVEQPTQSSARFLSTALLSAALEIYQPYFSPHSLFWARTRAYMRDWQAANSQTVPASSGQGQLAAWELVPCASNSQAQYLIRLGAPLKISALGVSLLTGHADFASLEQVLDHACIAAVLNDHALDCHADLDAGRWNFFVAAVSSYPQTADFQQANRARVAEAWSTSPLPRMYFNHITSEIERARALNRVPAVAAYLDSFLTNAWRTHDMLVDHYHSHLEQAAQTMFRALYVPARMSKGGATSPAISNIFN